MLRIINKLLCVAFVDLEKASDNVRWEKLFHITDKVDIDFKDKRLIHKLYINEKAVVKGEFDAYEEAKVQKGVRQECNLSPTLFNLYIEQVLKDLRYEDIKGIKIGGILVQMLQFAEDIAMIADSKENPEKMLQKMNNTLKQEYNMNIY
ncbi:Reverse transcriptase domain [Cinara cedri]|uniref:Reverse transcriptase domain n=1 Tax=Cinara cedri TaxID=506608 RepID=A0A5E4MQA2_9HEMI|nr:Reverse transcriptase domain [Cinara cedri]